MARRFFLVYFIFISCRVAGQSLKYVLKGQEDNLKPDITGRPDDILWKHNGNKVVEFNGMEEKVYDPYKNRITLDWHTAELIISDLRIADSGEYELEAYVKKELRRSQYKLEVMDKVAKPTISCEMNDDSSSDISGKLVCSAEPRQPQSLMKFEWISHGNVVPGHQLTISLGEQHDDDVYNCTVSNPLSRETAIFTAKDCYPVKSASTALIVSLVIIFTIIVLVILGILFCQQRHKACFAKEKRGDPEEQSPRGATEGPDKKTAQDNENRPLLDRAATLLSTQPLARFAQEQDVDVQNEMPEEGNVQKKIQWLKSTGGEAVLRRSFKKNKDEPGMRPQTHEVDLQDEMPEEDSEKDKEEPGVSPQSESPSPLEQNNNNDKGDTDADQPGEAAEKEDPQSANEPDPAGALTKSSEDVNPDLESSVAPEHPGLEKEKDTLGVSPQSESPSPLEQNNNNDKGSEKNKEELKVSPHSESPSLLEQNNCSNSDQGDADADQPAEAAEKEDPQSANQPDPVGVLAKSSEDMNPDLKSSNASEQPELEKEADESRPPPTPKSPNVAPKDTTDEDKEDTDSDQAKGEIARESDSENNELDDFGENKELSTVPEKNSSEPTLQQQDSSTVNDNTNDKEEAKHSHDSGESEG